MLDLNIFPMSKVENVIYCMHNGFQVERLLSGQLGLESIVNAVITNGRVSPFCCFHFDFFFFCKFDCDFPEIYGCICGTC